MQTKNFVVIEDDRPLADSLKALLEMQFFHVMVFHSAEEYLMNKTISPTRPYIYLIDLNLPGIAGHELIKVIRYKDKISPIFILSGASLDEALSSSLKAGADDFIQKPFNPDHLLLKIANARNRLRYILGENMDHGVKLFPEARLVSKDGVKMKLTVREYSILERLLSAPDLIHQREELAKVLLRKDISDRTIDVHISTLRKKIEGLKLEIETHRGLGYQIRILDHPLAA